MTTKRKAREGRTGNESTGEHPALTRYQRPSNWYCRVCQFGPMSSRVQKFCLNCGRDWFGRKGHIPSDEEKGFHPGIRSGIRN